MNKLVVLAALALAWRIGASIRGPMTNLAEVAAQRGRAVRPRARGRPRRASGA